MNPSNPCVRLHAQRLEKHNSSFRHSDALSYANINMLTIVTLLTC